jgi:hypothetical protein
MVTKAPIDASRYGVHVTNPTPPAVERQPYAASPEEAMAENLIDAVLGKNEEKLARGQAMPANAAAGEALRGPGAKYF